MSINFYSSITEISLNDFMTISNAHCLGSYHYYLALEESGCLSKKAGWDIHYFFRSSPFQHRCFIPLYIKHHSDGEFSFDHQWAKAYQSQYEESYYPKAQICLPFLPIEYQKIQTQSCCDQWRIEIKILKEFLKYHNLKSLHITFPLSEESQYFIEEGFVPSRHYLCYWYNNDYETFDDFLNSLRSKYRSQVIKERKSINAQGFSKEIITGQETQEKTVTEFFKLYKQTYLRKSWGNPPLNLQFFQKIVQLCPHNLVFFFLKKGDQYIAAACNILENETLHGRFWGSLADIPFIHFEVCYYLPFEYAIEKKISRMEAGLRNTQKELRGFIPKSKFNFHYFSNPSFTSYVESILEDTKSNFINIYKKSLPTF